MCKLTKIGNEIGAQLFNVNCFILQARISGRKKRGQSKSKDGKGDDEKVDEDKNEEKIDDSVDDTADNVKLENVSVLVRIQMVKCCLPGGIILKLSYNSLIMFHTFLEFNDYFTIFITIDIQICITRPCHC